VLAGAGNDTVVGGAGDDTLRGEAGNDKLYGGTGNDAAYGGDGADLYVAHSGVDYFDGGAGSWVDTVKFDSEAGNDFVIYANGERQSFDLADQALALDANSSGVIAFADGSEVAFDNLEMIEWS